MLKRKPADDHQGFAANKRGKSELVPSPLVFQREAQANDFDLAPEKAEKPHLQLPTVTSCVCHELCEKGNELLVVTNNKMFSEWNVPKNMASCSDNNELYLPAELQASICDYTDSDCLHFCIDLLNFYVESKSEDEEGVVEAFLAPMTRTTHHICPKSVADWLRYTNTGCSAKRVPSFLQSVAHTAFFTSPETVAAAEGREHSKLDGQCFVVLRSHGFDSRLDESFLMPEVPSVKHIQTSYMKDFGAKYGIVMNGVKWRLTRTRDTIDFNAADWFEVSFKPLFDLWDDFYSKRKVKKNAKDIQNEISNFVNNLKKPSIRQLRWFLAVFNANSLCKSNGFANQLYRIRQASATVFDEYNYENNIKNAIVAIAKCVHNGSYRSSELSSECLLELFNFSLLIVFRLLLLLFLERNFLNSQNETVDHTKSRDQFSIHGFFRRFCAKGDNHSSSAYIAGLSLRLRKYCELYASVDVAIFPNASFLMADSTHKDHLPHIAEWITQLSDAAMFDALLALSFSKTKNSTDCVDLKMEHMLDFRLASSATLGRIYEKLMHKKLVQTCDSGLGVSLSGIARSGNDARGVVFTPHHIAFRMCEQALIPLLNKCDTVQDVLKIKIIDPAMGTGHFLIIACDILAKRVHDLYLFGRLGTDKMPVIRNICDARFLVAENCLYGVEVHEFSAIIAQFCISVFAQSSAGCTPEALSKNLVTGDSILSRIHSNDDDKGISFVWSKKFPLVFDRNGKGGFDVILANPPYVLFKNIKDPAKLAVLKSMLQNRVNQPKEFETAVSRNTDLCHFFVERMVDILSTSNGGHLRFILPKSFLSAPEAGPSRLKLLSKCRITSITDISSCSVFGKRKAYPVIIACERIQNPENHSVAIISFNGNNGTGKSWTHTLPSPDLITVLENNVPYHAMESRLQPFITRNKRGAYLVFSPLLQEKLQRLPEQFSKRVKDCRLRVQMSRNYKFYHFASQCARKNGNLSHDDVKDRTEKRTIRKLLTTGLVRPLYTSWGFRYIKCHNMKLNDKGVAVSNKDNMAILTPHVEAENYEPVNSQLQHRATIAEPAIWFQATSQRVSCFYDPDGEYIGPTNPSIRALIHDNTHSDYFWFLSTWLNWDRISEWFTGRFSGEIGGGKDINFNPDKIREIPLPCCPSEFDTFRKDQYSASFVKGLVDTAKSIHKEQNKHRDNVLLFWDQLSVTDHEDAAVMIRQWFRDAGTRGATNSILVLKDDDTFHTWVERVMKTKANIYKIICKAIIPKDDPSKQFGVFFEHLRQYKKKMRALNTNLQSYYDEMEAWVKSKAHSENSKREILCSTSSVEERYNVVVENYIFMTLENEYDRMPSNAMYDDSMQVLGLENVVLSDKLSFEDKSSKCVASLSDICSLKTTLERFNLAIIDVKHDGDSLIRSILWTHKNASIGSVEVQLFRQKMAEFVSLHWSYFSKFADNAQIAHQDFKTPMNSSFPLFAFAPQIAACILQRPIVLFTAGAEKVISFKPTLQDLDSDSVSCCLVGAKYPVIVIAQFSRHHYSGTVKRHCE